MAPWSIGEIHKYIVISPSTGIILEPCVKVYKHCKLWLAFGELAEILSV